MYVFFFSARAFCLSEAQAELVKRAHAPAGHLRLQSENLGRRRRRAGSASRAQWCTLGKMHCAPSSVSRAPWERCTVCLVLYLAHLEKDALFTSLGGKHVLCTLSGGKQTGRGKREWYWRSQRLQYSSWFWDPESFPIYITGALNLWFENLGHFWVFSSDVLF